MGPQTAAAVLDAVIQILEIAAAAAAQRIERTVAEQAVEILRMVRRVAGEKFALNVLGEGIAALLRLFFKYAFLCHGHTLPVGSVKMIAELCRLVKWAKIPLP